MNYKRSLLLVAMTFVVCGTDFSPLLTTHQLPPYARCYSVALHRDVKLLCAAYCDRLENCIGFSFDKQSAVCGVCDYVRSRLDYHPAAVQLVPAFHLTLPRVERCAYGKKCLVQETSALGF